MKVRITLLTASLCFFFFGIAQAQNPTIQPHGGEVLIPRNDEPCLSEVQRNQMKAQSVANIAALRASGRYLEPNPEGTHPLFIWPVASAAGTTYNKMYSLSNYIDHNTAFPNQITDYNCGTRSYDTSSGYNHKGFDIVSWPFWWYQMDNNEAINIAAADGQIIDKNDGSFDRNCSFNNDIPNYIGLQHDDGSQSWYLHMKDGALTTKNIGDTVSAGEFLGVMGSSGSSSLPHLHFEVFDDAGELIDPSIGPCNSLNTETWWASQKPYYEPGINAALTHTAPPIFPNCPDTEVTNLENEFDSGDNVVFAIYLRDQRAGGNVHLKITRPDNSVLAEWDYALVDDFQVSLWVWTNTVDMEGIWIWEATYNGETASQNVYVGVLGVDEEALTETRLYPNPFDTKFFIESESNISKVFVQDAIGRIVSEITNYNESIREVETTTFSKGIYFVSVTSALNRTKTFKLIKK